MSAYDFRGRGKRNRAAFKEADDEANKVVRFAGGLFRGALRDVTNAARRREAAPTAASDVGLEASVEDNAPEDGGDVAVEASAASDAPKDGGDVAVEASAASDAPEKAAACGGATTTTSLALKYVERAHGGGVGGAPVAVEVFNAPLCAAIMNDETVRGVDFKSIVSEIHSRVSPSALSRDAFARWLAAERLFKGSGVTPTVMDACAKVATQVRRWRNSPRSGVASAAESLFKGSRVTSTAMDACAVGATPTNVTRRGFEETHGEIF